MYGDEEDYGGEGEGEELEEDDGMEWSNKSNQIQKMRSWRQESNIDDLIEILTYTIVINQIFIITLFSNDFFRHFKIYEYK